MASLLTSAQKRSLQNVFTNVHDTFARDIYVFVEKRIATRPSVASYNPLYGKAKDASQVSGKTVLTKFTFKARIFHENDQGENVLDGNGQLNLKSSDGRVRIKVDEKAYEKIKICSRIEVDDILYVVDSDAKSVGPFSATFFMLYLKREN
jgi:hypothetical protein